METKANKRKISYHVKPEEMNIDQWQAALRRQFAVDQEFEYENLGDHFVYSDFQIYNPKTDKIYKVAIRDKEFGNNFCSCPDFKINNLGTCKHIEFLLHELKKDPLNEKHWETKPVQNYSSVTLKYGAERKVILRVGLVNNEKIDELAKSFFNENNELKSESFNNFEDFCSQVVILDPDFRVYQDAMNFIINKRDSENREKIIDKNFPDGAESIAFYDLIKANLYKYQREGILKAVKSGRIIIADEMGLGKTIQAIASAEIMEKHLGVEKALIVCPTSLKYQWQSEIKKFTNENAVVIEGHLKKRKEQYNSKSFYKIISYGAIRNDIKYINQMGADLVILDEAQRIKNWKTKTAQNVKKINSLYALVLTGTPLENRLEELHSIVEFVDKYRLGALFRFLYNHQLIDQNGKVTGYKDLKTINNTLQPILVRRVKKEILSQLPERTDKIYYVKMTAGQESYHDDYYAVVCRLVNKWRKLKFLPENDRQRLLICLNCMRMVSDSTFILDEKSRDDTKIDELMVVLKEIFENNEKVVIFSQWERMTRLVAGELDKLNIKYEYLNGRIPSIKRKNLLDNFHNDPESKVFLSTDAGGVGLNLQCASVVINLDLPWNPAVLEQRIARVHRLGQKNHVRIINFVSKNSIEEKILYLISFKKSVFDGVFDKGEDVVILGENNFKKFMNSVESITPDEQDFVKGKKPDVKKEDLFGNETIETKKKASTWTQKKEPENKEIPNDRQKKENFNELITSGLSFISKLNDTISEINKGNIDLNSFIQNDNTTGETYFKIPVKNEDTVKEIINGLGLLFNSLTKK